MISLVVPNASAVFFSGRLIAQWTVATSALWAVLVALLAAGYWTWHRGRYPTRIQAPERSAEASSPKTAAPGSR